MKQTTIKKALKVINKYMKRYEGKLAFWLELKAETELHNENIKVLDAHKCDDYIQKYQIIIADLATIKRAIKSGKTEMAIYGTAELVGYVYNETYNVIKNAGFDIDGNFRTIRLIPIEEYEEEMEAEMTTATPNYYFSKDDLQYMASQLYATETMFDDN